MAQCPLPTPLSLATTLQILNEIGTTFKSIGRSMDAIRRLSIARVQYKRWAGGILSLRLLSFPPELPAAETCGVFGPFSVFVLQRRRGEGW